MTDDKNEKVLEISGPAYSQLMMTFAEISDNSLLALYGRVVETNTSENSDEHTKTDIKKSKIVLKSWSLEYNSGDELLCLDNPELIGFLRIRKCNELLPPSFRDRAIIRMLTQLQHNCVFISVTQEITDCLAIKYKVMGYKVMTSVSETLRNNVKIVVPCLGAKSEYKNEPKGSTSQILIQGTNNSAMESVVQSFEKIHSNFQKNANRLIEKIVELEEQKFILSQKVAEAKLKHEGRGKAKTSLNSRTNSGNSDLKSSLDEILRKKDKDLNMNRI